MKARYLILLVLVVLAFGAWTQVRQQWEYKFAMSPTEKKVNELASQGWELVAIDSTSPNIPTFVFKRAR